ncbi:type II toxin-antitoxin system death-on-curing family toxin [Candidatus Saccharibacteria bacterium]|nr:type II toxin-antitoxin system death-on-curing family toxin [Candidatus Saccharibacteria bacterium]
MIFEVFEAMIFEPKTDFSQRDISLDTLNEERRFWAKEGDSKSREFVLRGLYLSPEEILKLHFRIIEDFGGSHGVRDEGRLLSVVAAPQQTVFGSEQYPTVLEKAAVYLRNIIGDHPFVDGNKRAAVTIVGIFLVRNHKKLTAKPSELEDFAVQVAVEHLGIDEITKWLKDHSS